MGFIEAGLQAYLGNLSKFDLEFQKEYLDYQYIQGCICRGCAYSLDFVYTYPFGLNSVCSWNLDKYIINKDIKYFMFRDEQKFKYLDYYKGNPKTIKN